MLLYKPNQEFFERMRSNKFVIKQAILEKETLKLVIVDVTSNKAIKLIMDNAVSNNDNFNLENAFLIDTTIESYHKVFKTKYFKTKFIELRDSNGNTCKIERRIK